MALDAVTLLNEISNDPATRGYSGAVDDNDLLALLNGTVVGSNFQRLFISREECLSLMDMSEFAVLTDGKKNLWMTLITNGINPFGNEVQIAADIWGNPSNTRTAFIDARTTDVSRMVTLFGEGTVATITDVINARDEGAQRGVVI